MTFRRARASVLLLWLVACGGGGAAGVSVVITPRSTSVAAGGQVPFSATVSNASDTRVLWTVTEGAPCGSVADDGVYTAPATGGTCHVVATSAADPTRSATATVTVVPPDPCLIPADGAGFLLFTDARSGDFEIRGIKLDGTCDQLVGTGPDYDLDPSWSAATGLVAWGSTRGGSLSVVVQPVRGGAHQVLDTGAGLASNPALSPDGTLVAFERMVVGGTTADVLVVPVAGGTPAVVVDGTANEAGPVFSFTSRGNFVYFVSNRAGPMEVWRVPVSGAGVPSGAPEQVTTGSQLVGKATVSADGRYVAWCQASGAISPRIMVRDLETSQDRILSDEVDSEPAYAATGNLMAVKTERWALGTGDVALIDATTGALVRRLTTGAAMVGAPAFPR